MSDEGKAGVTVAIWALTFSAGLIIADHTKPLGKYRADAARRAEEAHSECTKFIGNLQRVHNK